ncbi:MAG: DUF4912 domain-containing protein [Gemmatales bacterium]|nr:DUF4912 domain-containing protein [Gemmatales bacterium]MCS7160200.1 DUF4912 domain-containing protein [Gemmatales bacterium]MDW8175400.1 DUF4912 domain-containing protein [Gemmatales bacterium]MDW8222288.1 DUF4912 domain-containing protein [Gemmatales bacterium]
MSSREQLQQLTKRQLLELARQRQVQGYSRLSKEELIAALSREPTSPARSVVAGRRRVQTRARGASSAPASSRQKRSARAARKVSEPLSVGAVSARDTATAAVAPPSIERPRSVARREQELSLATPEQQVESSKYDVGVPTRDLTAHLPRDLPSVYGIDRLVLLVRDPFWLHAYWELTPSLVERAASALGSDWHGSRLALRLLDVTAEDGTGLSETIVRDIVINEQARNWYIEVGDPPRSFRVDLGYLTPSGQFHTLLRSNVVSTPRAGLSERIDEAWADLPENYERILAMSAGFQPGTSSEEVRRQILERLRRPLASPMLASMASEALARRRGQRGFWFQVEAELIVYGATEPGAKVTLQGEPVSLRPDGTFTVRLALPNGRQIIPAVAVSPDGLEERTIVLAVERSTRALEPVLREVLAEV